MSFADMTRANPPPASRIDGGSLTLTTGDRTDFRRKTRCGFIRDTGHFLHHPGSGDFTAEVTIAARCEALLDRAGLILRLGFGAYFHDHTCGSATDRTLHD